MFQRSLNDRLAFGAQTDQGVEQKYPSIDCIVTYIIYVFPLAPKTHQVTITLEVHEFIPTLQFRCFSPCDVWHDSEVIVECHNTAKIISKQKTFNKRK